MYTVTSGRGCSWRGKAEGVTRVGALQLRVLGGDNLKKIRKAVKPRVTHRALLHESSTSYQRRTPATSSLPQDGLLERSPAPLGFVEWSSDSESSLSGSNIKSTIPRMHDF